MDLDKARAYTDQAQGRFLDLAEAIGNAQAGAPDWALIRATLRSLEANLVSAVAALKAAPEKS
jgi:hypothetical protein